MDFPGLPPELARTERLLTHGPRPMPSAALRRRVLGSVRTGLYGLRGRHGPRGRGWRSVAMAAAAMLVWIGLSFGAMEVTVSAIERRDLSPSVTELAARMQQISPNLTRQESLRQAALRRSGDTDGLPAALNDILPQHEYHDP